MKRTLAVVINIFFILVLCSCSLLQNTISATSTPKATVKATKTPRPTVASTRRPMPTDTPKAARQPVRTLAGNSSATGSPSAGSFGGMPTSSLTSDQGKSMANECRYLINNLSAYTIRDDFNPNMYFQFMTHIRMEDGYRLDYVLFSDELGAQPVVYARKTSDPAFASYEEFLASFGEEVTDERSYNDIMPHGGDFLEKVVVDGSPESYFEFAILAWQGDEFKLEWHGLYNDDRAICDSTDLTLVYEELEGFGIVDEVTGLTPDMVSKPYQIDLLPVVAVKDGSASIRFVSFSKWSGFYEILIVVDADDPMTMKDRQFNPLIEYDCGIAF
jgi:hypothetical protein